MSDHEIVPMRGQDALVMREQATTARAEITRAQIELEQQAAEAERELKQQMKALEAEFQRKRNELAERMAPLKAELAKMTEVLWTADLYLGRQENVHTLREGKPAPADTPITIRQKVLVMAEESLLYMEKGGSGMTAMGNGLPDFINWLVEDDDNLNRILPEPKGVVAMIPTRVESRTGNAWEDAAKDAANSQTYWLIRNGERVYLMTTDPELRATHRILPRRTEFTEVFDQRLFGFSGDRSKPVEPGSAEWVKMEERADARRRHYMRLMLVLQGLIDRTTVWHPLPPSGVNLLDVRSQDDGKVVLIQDDEQSITLTDGRESFAQWQRRLNGLLRVGMRVVGNFGSEGFRNLYDDRGQWSTGGHDRISPRSANYPESGVPYVIEDRRDGGFVIRYERTDEVWKRNVPVPDKPGYVYRGLMPTTPSRRASCVVKSEDAWILPYDLATVADLRYYLDSRENRSEHFLSMVPVLKAALAAKGAEAQAEAPFRDLLGRMLEAEGADAYYVPLTVDDLVHWWKVANAYARPLNGDPGHEKKACEEIVAEYRKRVEHEADPHAEKMLAAGRRVPGVIAVARNRQGKWFAYSPSTPAHDKGVYLDVTPIRRNGTLGEPKREQVLAQRSVTALHVAWSGEDWATWRFGANPRHYLTQSERETLTEEIVAGLPGQAVCVVEYFDPSRPGEREFGGYYRPGDDPEGTPAKESVEMKRWKVTKDAQCVHRTPMQYSRHLPAKFHHYSGGSPWGNTPWWPEDATSYGDVRPRLVWADEDALDQLREEREREKAASEERRRLDREREKAVYRTVSPLMEAMSAVQEENALRTFIEDYGPDSMDLWPRHLESLKLQDPTHPRCLHDVLAGAGAPEKDLSGKTLGQVIETARESGLRHAASWSISKFEEHMLPYMDIVIPEPEPLPEADPEDEE